METPDIMVDLETLGTRPGSAIASIGAVAFSAETGHIGRTFYQVVDLESCGALGLTIQGSTVLWWLQQSEAARWALATGDAAPLPAALRSFSRWFVEARGRRIWGHGANFDEPMLAAAYRAASILPPWQYWDSRCTRTIFELAGVKPERADGVHHNALDDAMAQAKAVIEARRILGLTTAEDEDGAETCIACSEPMLAGQRYFPDAEGGFIHDACCGPERESYTRSGEPLKDGDAIPEPYVWGAD